MEAVILTGGASRRMGSDKATLLVEGQPMAVRIAHELLNAGLPVTVLGRDPLADCAFIEDAEEHQGPLSALRRFVPSKAFVFVASCDMPLFRAEVVTQLQSAIGEHEAALPVLDSRRQPLCGLYRASAFEKMRDLSSQRMMDWIALLDVADVTMQPENLVRSCNTPEELRALESGP